MKRHAPLLWPALVAAVALAVTAWAWRHEAQTQERNLRSNFDFGLRQAAARVQQRATSYEQMLRGLRGLFEASDEVTPDDFATYVDTLASGPDFTGLRAFGYAPRTAPPSGAGERAVVAMVAPAVVDTRRSLGQDLLAEPVRRSAMLQARDSGNAAITARLPEAPADGSSFLLFMPVYAKGQPLANAAQRGAHLQGWLYASFSIGDLMSSLYGEGVPGLVVRIHDGVELSEATRLYPAVSPPTGRGYEAQEYVAFAGHTWTLAVGYTREFEQRFRNDAPEIIAITGGGLSLLLGLLTAQLVSARDRAKASAHLVTRQLGDSTERYRRIVETANEGIWLLDAAGRTSFVNPKMQALLGLDAEALAGRPWTDFMDEGSRATLAGEDADPLRDGLPGTRELRFRRGDGGELWAAVSTSPISGEDGAHAGALAMVTDITERRHSEARREQLEGQLRQSQKMEAIGTLAGGIAHDFNNILAAILGNTALARQDLGAGAPVADRLEQIRLAGERGRSLVQQIVAFSRRQPPERLPQQLQPVLEEASRLLRSTLPALVRLELRLTPEPLYVHADATQLQQVLLNLCTNAWHAMSGGAGRIVIGLERVLPDAPADDPATDLVPSPQAHLWVADDGQGMDEATRQRIFEPFFTTKPLGKGTGLGLAVVHGIVSAHGGSITVASTPGGGTRFDMHFALIDRPAPPSPVAPAAASTSGGGGEHLLYVDDDPVMGAMVQALLQRAGYRVSVFEDPREALAHASASDKPLDLVVTDYNMPGLSGLDLARDLLRLRPGLPVIISSGHVTEALRDEAALAGVRHVMQKEYTLEQLAALVQRSLAGA